MIAPFDSPDLLLRPLLYSTVIRNAVTNSFHGIAVIYQLVGSMHELSSNCVDKFLLHALGRILPGPLRSVLVMLLSCAVIVSTRARPRSTERLTRLYLFQAHLHAQL